MITATTRDATPAMSPASNLTRRKSVRRSSERLVSSFNTILNHQKPFVKVCTISYEDKAVNEVVEECVVQNTKDCTKDGPDECRHVEL